MTVRRATMVWIAAALLGVAATVAVAWAASRLAGQRIGLSAEPLSVASQLAPRSAGAAAPVRKPARKLRTAPRNSQSRSAGPHVVPTVPATVSAPTPAPVRPVPAPAITSAPAAPVARSSQQTSRTRDDSGGSQSSRSGPDD
jgi:hypothetical protein